MCKFTFICTVNVLIAAYNNVFISPKYTESRLTERNLSICVERWQILAKIMLHVV